jgi:hypothetical protein
MSNHRWCCCDEPTPVCGDFCCNTSYVTSQFTLNYLFEFVITGNNSGCTSVGFDFRRHYTIDLQFVVDPIVVTKYGCCYRGRGDVAVTGTVTMTEDYEGAVICPPPFDAPWTRTNTWQVEQTTCACISAICQSYVPHCEGVSGPAIQHTLEIGDFVVECGMTYYLGDYDTCPVEYGPFGLRCIGGRFAFKTDIDCLNLVGQHECMGWYPPTQQWCGTEGVGELLGGCFNHLESNTIQHGPFAMVLIEECSPGLDDFSCVDAQHAIALLPTLTGPSNIQVLLQSACANVDTDYDPCTTLNVAVRQQGGCPTWWTYS